MSVTTKHQRTKYQRPSTIVTGDDGTARVSMRLGENAIATILDALANERDPYGGEPTPTEVFLSNAMDNLRDFKAQA
jgi:hypothetical protein